MGDSGLGGHLGDLLAPEDCCHGEEGPRVSPSLDIQEKLEICSYVLTS